MVSNENQYFQIDTCFQVNDRVSKLMIFPSYVSEENITQSLRPILSDLIRPPNSDFELR